MRDSSSLKNKSVSGQNDFSNNETVKKTTGVFIDLMNTLREIDSEFPLQYCMCLAEISLNEGMSLTELSKKAGLGLSTISRIVGALSRYRQNGQPYGLVDIRVSATERRRKELYLTEKGRQVLLDISHVLDA